MTTYSKRRGRRSLAAILAAMLMASVLAVVAGSPAQAANTSNEVLIDTNADGVGDAREFAGIDRYDTALRLAKNFAEGKGGLGAVPAVFLASGESLVDSISVAGLAGGLDAPVLLTPSGSLHRGVGDFIEDYGVSTVYVLGGPAAISNATIEEIEALVNKPTVPPRLGGVDRYGTAAEIASMIDADSSWCGTNAVSAVLINGRDLPLGVAISTIAYRLQLPVLMTAADELPLATEDFIRERDVEHVQIIGGTDAVSAEVAKALTSAGVDTVDRVDGASAAEVSVALATAASAGGECNDALAPVANNRVVLVRGNPDGVAAAPVLASGIHNDASSGNLITPLIVDDSLPTSVSAYLAATLKTVGANKLNLGIIAIGGTAAVSADTMSAATTAAASSGALTVQIGAGDDPTTAGLEGDTNGDGVTNADDPIRPTTVNATFALYFSDDVTSGASGSAASVALLAELRDVIEINGVPAVVNDAVTGASGGGCANNVVYVTLGQTLRAGDTVSVAGSAHKLGTASDERTVVPASAKVQAAPADTTRPAVSIVAIAGPAGGSTPLGTQFMVQISDAGGLAADTLVAADFVFTPGPGSNNTATSALAFGGTDVIAANAEDHETLVTLPNALVVGDRLTLKAGVVEDAAGNQSTTRSGSAIKAQASPRITSVLMSNPAHSAQNSWTLPATAADASTVPLAANAVTITAKASGDAAGAAGNAWSILFDTASTYDATKAVDIDVRVDTTRQRATVRFVNGPATVHDLVAAMKANSDFDSRFSVTIPCTGTTTNALAVDSANRDVLATSADAGRTQFAIEANFNADIDGYTGTELLADVLAATAGRVPTAADVPALLALAGFTATPVTVADPTGPVTKVRYTFEIDDSTYLPQSRDLVMTTAGTAATSVAEGFAPDLAATLTVDEQHNAPGQVRIAVSSSVTAP